MRFDIITLFPEIFDALHHSIPGRAQQQGLLNLTFWNPRDFTQDRHRTVDDRPYGGGPGMLMKVEPLKAAIAAARAADQNPAPVIYLSPQGKRFTQETAQTWSQYKRLILISGRYEGVDERLLQTEIDEEWSIGDFVLSGGECAALSVVDAVTRLLPGALGDAESAQQDSFAGNLLDCPHYTRPEEVDGRWVPEILLNGDHTALTQWRLKQALGKTWLHRPDLLKKHTLNPEEAVLLATFFREHFEEDKS
jgi:tRNA (guanine37-N1)-methyltransferase